VTERFGGWLRPATYLGGNALTLTGVVITTSTALTMMGAWLLELSSGRAVHPYSGIVLFLVLPVLFVAGLLMIPAGVLLHRRKLSRLGQPVAPATVDFGSPRIVRATWLVAGFTLVNVVVMGTATSKGVEYLDSSRFCGVTCHHVMQPEYSAYQVSAHQQIGCAECHVGPGAGSFIGSKLAGVRRVVAIAFDTYSRPIPSHVEDLPSAAGTCIHCHSGRGFYGTRLAIRPHYGDDEKNTPAITVLALRLGGLSNGRRTGIHGVHQNADRPISFVAADPARQTIGRVFRADDKGGAVEFVPDDAKLASSTGARRTMDCTDCHNRAGHAFPTAEQAVDGAIASGRISAALPFVRKEAVAALKASYADSETARRGIESALDGFYRTKYPDTYRDARPAVGAAIEAAQALYQRYVVPPMKVGWGTYATNIGHQDAPGCFRCHDGNHKSTDGRVIPQDCETCHTVVAMEEENPKILTDLGISSF
jgi:hypothetical protein